MRRRPAQRGLSYFDANRGRLVTEGPDVLEIKRQIAERWPDLEVYFDVEAEEWVVVETCSDGVQRLALYPFKNLDQTVLQRLSVADQASRAHEDPLKAVEEWEAMKQQQEDDFIHELCGDVGERLAHAFRKDGLVDHENIYGVKQRPDLARLDRRVRSA